MLWTLQKYIFREMGRVFVLSSLGLIAVIGLGGGVMNMIELEGMSVLQLLKIMGLIVPVAATLTLPLAALYAATVTYGRLSADNEFVACRSGGINIHLLFLPTLVISFVSAIFSFMFINFMIPSMIMNIDRFVGDDLPGIIKRQLTAADRFGIRDKYVIYADDMTAVGANDVGANGQASLRLGGVAFVEMDGDNWNKFGTAESVVIEFGQEDGAATVEAELFGIDLYDAKAGSYSEKERLPIGRFPIPRQIPLKVKWLTLGGLLQYGRQPSLFPKIEQEVQKLRAGIARGLFYRDLVEQFSTNGEVTFGDAHTRYTVRAKQVRPDKQDRRPLFEGGVVATIVDADGRTLHVTADTATIRDNRAMHIEELRFHLRAEGNVTVLDADAPGGVVHHDREQFDSVRVDDSVLQQMAALTDDRLLDSDGRSLGVGTWVDERRERVIAEVGKVARDITGELNARMAFSMSVFVLVILGAALGIVFRGSQPLVAFGISFVPSLFVISTIIMGKQLIDNPATTVPGVVVVWLGILIVGAVDLFVLMKVLRR